MYFSAIPLLLLFASAICSSPIHIGRRMDTPGVPGATILINGGHGPTDLQLDKFKNNNAYHFCSRLFQFESRRFKGVDGVNRALEIEYGRTVIMRVEIKKSAVGRLARDMVNDLGQDLVSWGWGNTILGTTRVPVFVEMVPRSKETLKQCLVKLDAGPDSPTHLSPHWHPRPGT